MAWANVIKKTDAELKAAFEKYDAMDASSSGMDVNEFKEMMRKEFNVEATDAELEAAFAAANDDDSADAMGDDMCVAEFMKWIGTIRAQ